MNDPLPTDLFLTKGLEYVLVLGFLAALVLFWQLLLAKRPTPAGTAQPEGPFARTLSGWFGFPLERFYHPGHAWVRPDADGLVTVGLDDFAQKVVGPAEQIALPKVGARLQQGHRMSRLSVGPKGVDVQAPLDGEIVERNDVLAEHPELMSDDPYGRGWLFRVRPSRLDANFEQLLQGGAARAWMDSLEDSLRRRMSPSFGLLMQDGGVPVSGIARVLAGDEWDELASELLSS
ncbi:MAG: glycine cleavage system protein H [Planctomycetes bacterium]|nr:glycine cleavage system protein H [Planctomycetota bacterium]